MSSDSQWRAVRECAGVWLDDTLSFLRIHGKDAASWLQTQVTSNVLDLQSGSGQQSVLLDRKGRIQGVFTLHRWQDEYWTLMEKASKDRVLERLDAHLFIEDAHLHDASQEVELVALQGARALPFLVSTFGDDGLALDLLPHEPYAVRPIEVFGFQVLAFRLSLTGEDGFVLAAEAGDGTALLHRLLEAGRSEGVSEIDPPAREVLRIEAGIPQFGVELDHDIIVSETPLEAVAVSYDKGCYLGQEVVARLKSRGSVKQALVGLVIEGDEGIPSGTVLKSGGKKAGVVRSCIFSPEYRSFLALAYMGRDWRVSEARYEFVRVDTNAAIFARVRLLPMIDRDDPKVRAVALYHEALDVFKGDPEDKDDRAIKLLREAILLFPAFEDAYEVLGVILHRHGQLDEAITWMKRLVKLNDNCMMAHTNLSVFYAAKGDLEAAEVEKAKAAVLGIQSVASERQAKEHARKEREALCEEARERIGMFEEVLEIDPEDTIATFGMGSALMQLETYAEAAPFLARTVKLDKDYSAAYLKLGQCYEYLGQRDQAIDAYQRGVAVASRKGDLMPLKDMERRLKGLR